MRQKEEEEEEGEEEKSRFTDLSLNDYDIIVLLLTVCSFIN